MTPVADTRSWSGIPRWLVAALVVLALAALALYLIFRGEHGFGLDGRHGLHSVQLVNSQIYFGQLEHAGGDYVVLTDVFYVQALTDSSSHQTVNKLVRRVQSDWHGPVRMIIPKDKILLIEEVGPTSRVAQLIAEAKRLEQAPTGGAPKP